LALLSRPRRRGASCGTRGALRQAPHCAIIRKWQGAVKRTQSAHSSLAAIMTRQLERAVLAGGCFWGMQDLIRKLQGVVNTRVGYTGGDVPNATYRTHGSHAEAIEIEFDPAHISYRDLLE